MMRKDRERNWERERGEVGWTSSSSAWAFPIVVLSESPNREIDSFGLVKVRFFMGLRVRRRTVGNVLNTVKEFLLHLAIHDDHVAVV